jgi:hypothetical protein
MAREPQRANGSESLALLSMSNGPGRYSPSRASGVGTVGFLPPLPGSGYRTIILYSVSRAG